MTKLGYSWSYTHRGYQVFYKGEFIHGAGITHDAKSPTGRAANNERDENYYHGLLEAERHYHANGGKHADRQAD